MKGEKCMAFVVLETKEDYTRFVAKRIRAKPCLMQEQRSFKKVRKVCSLETFGNKSSREIIIVRNSGDRIRLITIDKKFPPSGNFLFILPDFVFCLL